MGLLDKVKAQATAATEMAKDAAAKGQAKMNDAQAKKTADGMLRDLGAAYYATQTGRSTPTTDADIAQLVTSLQAHESEHGQITLAPESAAAAPTATPAGDGSAPRLRRRPRRRPTRHPRHRLRRRPRRCSGPPTSRLRAEAAHRRRGAVVAGPSSM